MTDFRVIGELAAVETIAEGKSIRESVRLVKAYGQARWRKRKGVATVELATRHVRRVELHGYEAHGISKVEMKTKRYVE